MQCLAADPGRRTARTFVLAHSDGQVIAYYTLVAGQAERRQATAAVAAGTSARFPIPICLRARLAVDLRAQGAGLGAALLEDALRRVLAASEQIGIRAVVVHAIDEAAARFYEHFGSAPLTAEPTTLMVPLQAVREVLAPAG